MTKADGTTVEHVYDVDGNLVRTTVTPTGSGAVTVTNYLVDSTASLSQIVAETDGAGVVGAYYVRAGNDVLAVRRAPALACYLRDGLGSIRGLVDADGALTDTKAYAAFGETIAVTGIDPQPYGFAGERLEPVTGLSYHRARWMAPKIGAFVAMDMEAPDLSDPRTIGRYTYAANSPASFTDASGRVFASLIDVQASQIIQSSLANVQANVGLAFKDQLEFRGYSGLISLGVSTLLPIAIVKTWKLAGRLIRNPVEMALKLAAKLPASTKCLGVCNEFAAALRQALVEAQVPGKLIRIDAGPSSHIHSDTLGPLSGTESFHEAIQVGDKVFDNMRPEGMPIQMFFDDLGGREFLVRETGARIRWTDF